MCVLLSRLFQGRKHQSFSYSNKYSSTVYIHGRLDILKCNKMERKCRFKPIFSESVPLDSTQCHIGCKIGVQEVAGSSQSLRPLKIAGLAVLSL